MRTIRQLLWLMVFALLPEAALGGGSGLNVIVVANRNSTNSLQLANDYCEARGVPPQNVLLMDGWTGGNVVWTRPEFESLLLNPLLALVSARGLSNQAVYVLLSMDIPYTLTGTDGVNSTTSALYYGYKPDTNAPPGLPYSCSLPDYSTNSFFYAEVPFRVAPPNTATTTPFLAMMLTDTGLAGAEAILTRAAASDGTFPSQRVILAKTTDWARNVRYLSFDNAVFNARIFGGGDLVRVDTDSTSFTNLLGMQTGLYVESFPSNAFLPGAIADTLTSFGGQLFGSSGQTPLLAFLDAGAAGSYGAVLEPCNYTQKFPDSMDFVLQHRGFSLAEAYYQSVQNPYQGVFVGEPLAAPFAQPGTGVWNAPAEGAAVSGRTTLDLAFTAATNRSLARVELFVDGTYFSTLTNIVPAVGNTLSLTLNGVSLDHVVASNATPWSIVSNWAAAINLRTNETAVQATASGDRLMLQGLDVSAAAGDLRVTAAASPGSAASLTTFVREAKPGFLDTVATGYRYLFITNNPSLGDWIRLDIVKTNGGAFTYAVTNSSAGTTVGQLFLRLVQQVLAAPAMKAADGVVPSDFLDYAGQGLAAAEVFMYAGSPGWQAAQIGLSLTCSTNLQILADTTTNLDDNLSDLQPRYDLFISTGGQSLSVHASLDTTTLPDGFHELTAVAYQGDSVETQTRISRSIIVRNRSLAASFPPLPGGATADVTATLPFSITAGSNAVARIDLFSTGGRVASATNQATAVLPVAGATLGVGLHPFYALVTGSDGGTYRTETRWVRLVVPGPPFPVSVSSPPLSLSWPATSGTSYDVLSSTSIQGPFQVVGTVVATGAQAGWTDTNSPAGRRFYSVRTSP